MKRDMELVRTILLKIEEGQQISSDDIRVDEFDQDTINYHIGIMAEAGLVNGNQFTRLSGNYPDWIDLDLSWTGQELLSTIRDAAIWAKTKSVARKVGSASVDFLWEATKEILKQELKNKLGLPN